MSLVRFMLRRCRRASYPVCHAGLAALLVLLSSPLIAQVSAPPTTEQSGQAPAETKTETPAAAPTPAVDQPTAALASEPASATPQSPAPATPEAKSDSQSAHSTPPALPSAVVPASADSRLTFSFRNQPWQTVLDWFAEQAALSLLMESPPPGTFNYTDPRKYTVAEALDVLNGVLLTKGYTLVRRERMLVVIDLEDGIPPNLVPDVSLAELDRRGEYELIRVLFSVWTMTPEQAAIEVQPLLGPQGKVIVLPQARQIQVTETAGRLRTIRSVVNAVEQPELGAAGMREFTLNNLTFETAMLTIRQMLGIPPDTFGTPDGSVQITKSALGDKLLFRGPAQQAARLAEVLRLIDVPEAASGLAGAARLEVYSVTTADPEVVVKTLQVLLRNDPNVVLTADKAAGHVIAFASPAVQDTVKATIARLQSEARQVDVISLSNVDPQVAVLAINKLFGSLDDKPDPTAPRIDADLTTRSLMVRGTVAQVEQIRDLLRRLGETEEASDTTSNREHVRMLPLSGSAARSAISQIQEIWPSMRPNRIRIVTPSSTIQSYRPSEDTGEKDAESNSSEAAAAERSSSELLQEAYRAFLRDRASAGNRTTPARNSAPGESTPPNTPPTPPTPNPPANGSNPNPTGAKQEAPAERAASLPPRSVFRLVGDVPTPPAADPTANQQPPPQPQPAASTSLPTRERQGEGATPSASPPSATVMPKEGVSTPGSPVIVAPGPGGTIIASDDLEALDELEELLNTVADQYASSSREYAVYYLKYSKAATVADVLAAIFGGTPAGKDRGLIGDMASNALGNLGGGLMGDLLLGGAGGGTGFSSASIDIVPDVRLNAIIVNAKPTDHDTIEQLLKVLDQRAGPENVEAEALARPIPVYYAAASDIAAIVQQVYQDRMTGTGGAISPQEMMKMIRGGNSIDQQAQKMSIAIDSRNNMLIVRAPDPLFDEVKALVGELDHAVGDSPEVTRIVSLKHTNSSAVKQALTSVLGNVKTSTTAAAPASPATPPPNNEENSREEQMRRSMRRNWEMMQEFRRMQQEGGGFPGGPPGGPGGPGGGPGGRGGRGGRGR
ncbi:MAG: hypothetical protein IT425_02105 [Pirellulales bacterium]|nr:hypothetical protein [Pirellulales bacterium]